MNPIPVDLGLAGKLLLATAAVVLYYRVANKLVGRLSRPLVSRLGLDRRYPLGHVDSTGKLLIAGLTQMIFCGVLLLVTGISLGGPPNVGVLVPLVGLGLVLGAGEMAFSGFLATILVSTLILVGSPGAPRTVQGWVTLSRGGWVSEYLSSMEVLPRGLSVGLSALYVGGEELVFRAVLIPYFLPHGAVAAVTLSTLLFVLVQLFHVPSWRAALFPAVGALVIGVSHGALYLAMPYVLPLMVAHLAFFYFAVA